MNNENKQERIVTRIDLSAEHIEADFDIKFMKSTISLPRTFMANHTAVWVDLIPEGSVVHRDNREIRFTREMLDEIIEVFSRYKNPIVVDFNHNTKYAEMRPTPTETAGFCDGLAINHNGMFAHYLLNPEGVESIRSGHNPFSSPTLLFDALDRKTGKRNRVEMPKIALTADPAIDGQDAINLAREDNNMPFEKKQPEEKPTEEAPTADDQPPPAATSNPLQKLADAAGIPIEAVGNLIDERLDALVAVLKGENLGAGCAGMSPEQRTAVIMEKKRKGELTNMSNAQETTEDKDKIVLLNDAIASLKKENADLKAKQDAAEQQEFARKLDAKMVELVLGGMKKEREDLARKYFTRAWDEADAFFNGIKDVPVGEAQAGTDPAQVVTTYENLSANQKYKFDTMRRSGSYGTLRDEELIKELLILEGVGG